MNKLKTFFYSFKQSATNTAYYKDILKAPFSFSWKYLYFLSLLVVLVGFVKFIIVTNAALPELTSKIQEFKKGLQTAYPPELKLEIKDGEMTTNVENPYYIDPVEPSTFENENSNKKFDHFITIDTEASVEDYENYNTLVLLTKTAAIHPKRNNQSLSGYEVTEFKSFKEPFTLDKNIYDKFVVKANPYIDSIPKWLRILSFLSILLAPLVALIVAGWHMFYLLFATVVPWVVSKLFKNNLTYGQVYQLGMHGLTVPILVTSLLALFAMEYAFLFTGIFFLWMAIVLAKLGDVSKEVQPVVEEKTA